MIFMPMTIKDSLHLEQNPSLIWNFCTTTCQITWKIKQIKWTLNMQSTSHVFPWETNLNKYVRFIVDKYIVYMWQNVQQRQRLAFISCICRYSSISDLVFFSMYSVECSVAAGVAAAAGARFSTSPSGAAGASRLRLESRFLLASRLWLREPTGVVRLLP